MFADVRYQIFISSTYEDLRLERQQVTQAILELGHMAVGMELFPASDMQQSELIKRVIDETDYYVVIVGGRYGSIDEVSGLSYTEMEYDYALERGIPILGFVRDNIENLPAKFVETDKQKKEKLNLFREKVLNRICRKFNDANELGLHVLKSLVSEIRLTPRTGWVKANQAKSVADLSREQDLRDTIDAQGKEIKRLKRLLRDGATPISKDVKIPSGGDIFSFTCSFNDKDRQFVTEQVPFKYDEILKVIGPSMFGYIQRRAGKGVRGPYSFETDLVEAARIKILDRVGSRQINLVPHQLDLVLLHFKQMGILEYNEVEEEEGGTFRGLTLTESGEKYLTTISLQ